MDEAQMRHLRSLRWTVELVPYQAGDPTARIVAHKPSGDVMVPDPGYSLAELRAMIGGNEGELTDPFGNKHRVSLKKYVNSDPVKTRFRVNYKSQGFERASTPARRPGSVI